jgi:hypothetical protein
MKFKSRDQQEKSTPTLFSEAAKAKGSLSDDLFDTSGLPRPTIAVRWRRETDVHNALRLTDSLANTNQFVGTQAFLVRDEVRERTLIASIELGGLYLSHVKDGNLTSRSLVHAGDIRRVHLCLRKFDGIPLVCYVASDQGKYKLYINGKLVSTTSDNIDFPHLEVEQPPIGFAATSPPTVGILTYKCRTTGTVFLRRIDPMSLVEDTENDLKLKGLLGGVEVGFGNKTSLLKAEVIAGNTIQPIIMTSDDYFATNSGPKYLDISSVPHDFVLPGASRVFVDHTKNTHISLAVQKSNNTTALDALPNDDLIVAAIEAVGPAASVISVFPSMPSKYPPLRFGFGDGEIDGAGIIATVASDGRLLASNSQSGGFSYPKAVELNYDMQKMFIYSQSQCYTRGIRPNFVSMDYVFVEADDSGRPLSAELWHETWDMPLPEPIVRHSWDGDRLKIIIEKSAWFFPGQTTFWIEPAVAEITKAEFVDFREMILEFNEPNRVKGTRIWFETKNVFYHHRGFVDA